MRLSILILALLPLASLAADYPDPSRWAYTVGGFTLEDEILGPRPGAIVATGSSSMRFWQARIHADLAPLTVIPRGFGGSNMNDLLTYLDEVVLKHEPRAVMIYEGDNDVAQGVPVEKILATFETALARIHARDPAIRVYLLAVKPSLSRAAMWSQMQAVNQGLQAFAKASDTIFYLDVATPMLDADGSVRDDLFVSDGLHMNQRGYDLWRNAVAPVLIEHEIRYEGSPVAQ